MRGPEKEACKDCIAVGRDKAAAKAVKFATLTRLGTCGYCCRTRTVYTIPASTPIHTENAAHVEACHKV